MIGSENRQINHFPNSINPPYFLVVFFFTTLSKSLFLSIAISHSISLNLNLNLNPNPNPNTNEHEKYAPQYSYSWLLASFCEFFCGRFERFSSTKPIIKYINWISLVMCEVYEERPIHQQIPKINQKYLPILPTAVHRMCTL